MFKKILVAVNDSEYADKAADLAVDMAKVHGAELVAVHVTTFKPLTKEEMRLGEAEYADEVIRDLDVDSTLQYRGRIGGAAERIFRRHGGAGLRIHLAMGQQLMDALHSRAMAKGVSKMEPVITDGDPAESILRVAKEHGADLIVIGSRGMSEIKGLLSGSVSQKVMRLAECPCLVVH
ncbi:MAG: universal stress protein [Rhodospirillales bacterium]|nr:universal stress protein [Rhodospirillales bacterium]